MYSRQDSLSMVMKIVVLALSLFQLVSCQLLVTDFSSLSKNSFGSDQGDGGSSASMTKADGGGMKIRFKDGSYWYSVFSVWKDKQVCRSAIGDTLRFYVENFVENNVDISIELQTSTKDDCENKEVTSWRSIKASDMVKVNGTSKTYIADIPLHEFDGDLKKIKAIAISLPKDIDFIFKSIWLMPSSPLIITTFAPDSFNTNSLGGWTSDDGTLNVYTKTGEADGGAIFNFKETGSYWYSVLAKNEVCYNGAWGKHIRFEAKGVGNTDSFAVVFEYSSTSSCPSASQQYAAASISSWTTDPISKRQIGEIALSAIPNLKADKLKSFGISFTANKNLTIYKISFEPHPYSFPLGLVTDFSDLTKNTVGGNQGDGGSMKKYEKIDSPVLGKGAILESKDGAYWYSVLANTVCTGKPGRYIVFKTHNFIENQVALSLKVEASVGATCPASQQEDYNGVDNFILEPSGFQVSQVAVSKYKKFDPEKLYAIAFTLSPNDKQVVLNEIHLTDGGYNMPISGKNFTLTDFTSLTKNSLTAMQGSEGNNYYEANPSGQGAIINFKSDGFFYSAVSNPSGVCLDAKGKYIHIVGKGFVDSKAVIKFSLGSSHGSDCSLENIGQSTFSISVFITDSNGDEHGYVPLDKISGLNSQKLAAVGFSATPVNKNFTIKAIEFIDPSTLPCYEKYKVVSGDYCYKIATDNGLSTDQLLFCNPNLQCENLQIGQELCVNCYSPCNSRYKVKAGDGCYAIASSHGLTLDNLKKCNPGINCDNLQIDQLVCVNCDAVTSYRTVKTVSFTTTTKAAFNTTLPGKATSDLLPKIANYLTILSLLVFIML